MIRDQILRLAMQAEAADLDDTAKALYLLASTMDRDGQQCRFFGRDGATMGQISDIGRVVGLSLKLPAPSLAFALDMED